MIYGNYIPDITERYPEGFRECPTRSDEDIAWEDAMEDYKSEANKPNRIFDLMEYFCINNNILVNNKLRDVYLEECGYYGKEFIMAQYNCPFYGKDKDIIMYEINSKIEQVNNEEELPEDAAWDIFDTLSSDILEEDYHVSEETIMELVNKITKELEA